jgi:hypothetical protein
MDKVVFDDETLKKVYSFKGNGREEFEHIKNSIVEVEVENDKNEAVVLRFRVTRDAHLGMRQRWVYGELLDTPAGEYHQVEVHLHEDEPESDSIAVFLMAPPLMFNKLR